MISKHEIEEIKAINGVEPNLSRHIEEVVLWFPTLVATLANECAPLTLNIYGVYLQAGRLQNIPVKKEKKKITTAVSFR